MLIRRALYYAQFAAVAVLPLWIVVARTLSTSGLGSQDVLVFLSWPLLAVALIGVLGVTLARRSVRLSRTVSWADVASLSAWYASAIAYGAFVAASSTLGSGLGGGLLALMSLVAFAVAVKQLVDAARHRVRTVLAGLDRGAIRIDAPSGSRTVDRH